MCELCKKRKTGLMIKPAHIKEDGKQFDKMEKYGKDMVSMAKELKKDDAKLLKQKRGK